MAAAAKMDELLVSWLSSDNVYENVLSLIETYRTKGNGIVKSPPSSPQFHKHKDMKKEQKEQLRSQSVPPFYRPPGMPLPPIRRNSMDSDQSWDGLYHEMQTKSNETKSSKLSSSENDGVKFIPIKEHVKIIFAEFAVPENKESGGVAHNVLTIDNFVKITKDICRFPTFFNRPLYRRILYLWNVRNIKNEKQRMIIWNEFEKQETLSVLGIIEPKASNVGGTSDINELLQHLDKNISLEIFQWFWKEEMQDYDMEERFFRLLKKPFEDFVDKNCFMPFMQELLNDHPGLEFLSNHAEFQDKYALTVITRIFYSVNRCHSGRITLRQIKRSKLLSAFYQVDEEEDINKVTKYFSYEHFYVLYCRFWELDHDRDYKITREDLLKYGDQCLSHMIVDRIFEAAPRPFGLSEPEEEIIDSNDKDGKKVKSPKDYLTYEDFIFFMMSEEDKANEISVRYWFHCIDVDGDGKLNNMEMRSFYALQQRRMQQLGHEHIPFEDMLCQMIDMIKPKNEDYLVVEDFLQEECQPVSGALFDALFNLNKYLSFEQRDPFQERQKREDEFETDWDRFACMDYNRLAMEEEAREEDAMEIDWVSVDDDEDDSEDFNLGLSNEAPF
jgi:serine/threonine-protein phosphatase 2A regulatory subunit B''